MLNHQNAQAEAELVFSSDELEGRPSAWSGQALFLGSDYVVRQCYRMGDGVTLRLNPPATNLYELTSCGDGWFLAGVCGRKRVTIHVFMEEVLEGKLGSDPERVLALHLIVMPPDVGLEMMERFGADRDTFLHRLAPWEEWTESRAALYPVYDAEPWLDGPDPIDLTVGPVIVAFAE